MTITDHLMPIEHHPSSSDEPQREFFNRDLQWLEFNRRVLHQVREGEHPLLERVRFHAIFSSNLDEFFMKRAGGLRRQIAADVQEVAYEGVSPDQLLWAIRDHVIPMERQNATIFAEEIRPALRDAGIELLSYTELTDEEKARTRAWYRSDVFPLLTPLAVDPGHRFPFISNLSISLGVMLRRPGDSEPLFARVKVPEVVVPWFRVGEGHRFVELADVIQNNIEDLFPGMEILEVLAFRVTRNADIGDDDEDVEDLLSQIQQQLRERRFAPVVRLQVGRDPSPDLMDFLCEAMQIEARDIYEMPELLDYRSLDVIADLPLAEHRYSKWTPITPPRLRDTEQSVFAAIRQGPILVHHPYESFDSSVERFIEEAADDPNVLGIKQALYRTSGDSPFVHSLIRAAELGKQVAVLVELRARFDEARNIHWAQKLEDAGVHVAYGVIGLKTHTKITLVVRREHDGLRCYSHVGTGNYHSKTAKLYEDVGLLTCDPAITGDVVNLFNYMTGRSRQDRYEKLLVAPNTMKARFLELIEREMHLQRRGEPGHIIAKMNQLQDREIIRALYKASQHGVKVDLLVRGFCTLRPGVPGMSENIRVMSVIGRFLEHSRIFWFRNGQANPLDGDFFIGSADWMYRNLNNRIEAIVPIEGTHLRDRLWTVLQTSINDHRTCWDMMPDGAYEVRTPASDSQLGTHDRLMALADFERSPHHG